MPPSVPDRFQTEEEIGDGGQRERIVVCGLGMVGLRFCEKLVELDDVERRFEVVVFCEEDIVAYNRVGLTSYFTHRSLSTLLMQPREWYTANRIQVIQSKVTRIDSQTHQVYSDDHPPLSYTHCILATGSEAFMPPIPGHQLPGVFVYRTVKDLEGIIKWVGQYGKKGVVIGGGLLGLEAAKACVDLGMEETIVIERNEWLMNRQLDREAGNVLLREIEKVGVGVLLSGRVESFGTFHNQGRVDHVVVQTREGTNRVVECDVVIVAAGIRPRDQVAKVSGAVCHDRGGIVVDDELKTSLDDVYAIGECVVHGGLVYGLVAPGYAMAETLAHNLYFREKNSSPTKRFTGADVSTKLKLLGIQVASFGEYFHAETQCTPLTYRDPFAGIYKRLLFSVDGKKLLGGILVGDTKEYMKLLGLVKSGNEIGCEPGELVLGTKKEMEESVIGLPDDTQICSCNNVTKQTICQSVTAGNCQTLAQVQQCTKAGTGCGGCIPLIKELFEMEMKKSGKVVTNALCEHFGLSRRELFDLVRVKGWKSFREVLENVGTGDGCEICKPTLASIFASLHNSHILTPAQAPLQETNDRYLANIQRGGSYSVVPRIPGGEITPSKLSAIASVAEKYHLYTKITGGQRIDLFGAEKWQLPSIWDELVAAGFESGHAYGKALRTVKSCVGSTWCRYGVGDSVGLAIRVENRYKGIRAPHKLKGGVSGCIRECAEAQGKDFGLIATEKGYNLYVCGNGGSNPKHAVLLIGDVDEEGIIKYLDRFIMYYIFTADKLQRTARWLEKMEGGIEYLRSVVVDDRLGICDELEKQMQYLVDTYQCEWKTVTETPHLRRQFTQFTNTSENERSITFINERGQSRPADWPKSVPDDDVALVVGKEDMRWLRVGTVDDFMMDAGVTVRIGKTQIAVFRMRVNGAEKWYATQNMCPHKRAFVLSSSLTGTTTDQVPKIACPNHKKPFSLLDGSCLTGESYKLQTFEVKREMDEVFIRVPSEQVLDDLLATEKWMIREDDAVKMQVGVEVVKSGRASVGCGDSRLDW